jgi:hypothetical protein
MKKLLFLSIIFMACMCSVSCNGDDDGDGTDVYSGDTAQLSASYLKVKSNIIGTWGQSSYYDMASNKWFLAQIYIWIVDSDSLAIKTDFNVKKYKYSIDKVMHYQGIYTDTLDCYSYKSGAVVLTLNGNPSYMLDIKDDNMLYVYSYKLGLPIYKFSKYK